MKSVWCDVCSNLGHKKRHLASQLRWKFGEMAIKSPNGELNFHQARVYGNCYQERFFKAWMPLDGCLYSDQINMLSVCKCCQTCRCPQKVHMGLSPTAWLGGKTSAVYYMYY